MDDMFINPPSAPILNSDGLEDSEAQLPSIKNMAAQSKRSLRLEFGTIFPYFFIVLWVSTLTFYVPGVIPYQTSSDVEYFWLNACFLIFPSLGAFFTIIYQFSHFWILVIIQAGFSFLKC